MEWVGKINSEEELITRRRKDTAEKVAWVGDAIEKGMTRHRNDDSLFRAHKNIHTPSSCDVIEGRVKSV
jgi:hypothetical protein